MYGIPCHYSDGRMTTKSRTVQNQTLRSFK